MKHYRDVERLKGPGGAPGLQARAKMIGDQVPSKMPSGASLVAQWLRICLLMQGTRVRALVWEGSHMPRSDWAREPQLLSLRVWSLCSATREAAIVRGPRTAI